MEIRVPCGKSAWVIRLALPSPKRARIQVHEIRRPVIADAAALQFEVVSGETRAIRPDHADIGGSPLHMQAALRDTRSPVM